jgi:hypothetical protein
MCSWIFFKDIAIFKNVFFKDVTAATDTNLLHQPLVQDWKWHHGNFPTSLTATSSAVMLKRKTTCFPTVKRIEEISRLEFLLQNIGLLNAHCDVAPTP